MKTFWNQIYDWLQNRNCFFLILHWVSFPTKKGPIIKNWLQKTTNFFLDLSLGIPYIVIWFNVCNKELLALRNNFRVTKKFLIAKFDCTKNCFGNKIQFLYICFILYGWNQCCFSYVVLSWLFSQIFQCLIWRAL